MPSGREGGGRVAHLGQLAPHADPAAASRGVGQDEVERVRADAQGAGAGELGHHTADACGEHGSLCGSPCGT